MSYEVGQTVRVPVVVKNDTGQLTDATLVPVVTRPDATLLPTPLVVHPSTGNYYIDVVATTPGPWMWTWTASGTVAAAVYTGQFWVRVPGPRLLGLSEIKTHLNKSLSDTTDDEELMDWIDAARWVIESITGPVIPTTYTETHAAGRARVIRLRRRPVMSVASVTVNYGGGDIRTLTAEPPSGPPSENQYLVTPSGMLYHRQSGWTRLWPGDVTVTYTAGRMVPTDNLRMAARELITHGWRQSQLASGGTRPRTDGPDPVALTYGVPNRVRELLTGQKRAPRLG